MITLAVDAQLALAQQVRDMMAGIDPKGTHYAGTDPEEMLALVKTAEPDIVFIEIDGQASKGLDMAAGISRDYPGTNLILITEHPEYAAEAFRLHASGFMLKPVNEEKLREELSNLRHPLKQNRNSKEICLTVHCFGNFEAFGKYGIVRFARSRSKEALAYLVDRRGAGCTVGEICSVLWEDRQADRNLKSQCRVILSSLKKDLEVAGADDVLIKNWNIWAVDTDRISCDYYDYLDGDISAHRLFHGEYMAQYSWAEMTAGGLTEAEEDELTDLL